MPKKTAPIEPLIRDKLIIAINLDDIVAAVNQAMRVRKITMTIDYTNKDRLPRLLLSMPDGMPGVWKVINPKRKATASYRLLDPDLSAAATDIEMRLAKLNARLTFMADKPPGQKTVAKLQVVVEGARRIVLTLFEARDGQFKQDTSFQTPDGRTP